MKKQDWLIVFFPLFLTWVLDRLTKQWAVGLIEPKLYGFLNFILHYNPGAMLGLFADLPPVLRIVSLSTGGAFLFCTYALIQYLLPIKSLILRSGLSILIGGILGNVSDRIIYGQVVDFIVFKIPLPGVGDVLSPAFNIADALQWVGYAMIVYCIIKEGDLLWPEYNVRKHHWINPRFQLKYCFFLLGSGLGIGMILLVFSYTYLRVTMVELTGHNTMILDKFLAPYVITFTLITIGFCMALFTVGKLISHKIAGPIYAFEKFINDSMEGKNRPFRLRTKDEFKHLEALALKIQQHLIQHGALSVQQNTEALPAEQMEVEGAIAADQLDAAAQASKAQEVSTETEAQTQTAETSEKPTAT